jgi:2-(1,2-epoxy-1,2-dihydrophenyl)acetyl-CoA isomerase
MTYKTVIYEEIAPHVVQLVLNRPEKMNAYNHQLCSDLLACLHDFQVKDEHRVLILTGEGRGFCSGGDISGPDDHHADFMNRQLGHGREMIEGMQNVVLQLTRLDKPVIAAINGPAVAGGLALALACDFRMASENAKLGDTSGKMALLPDEGGAWLFPHVMGYERAFKMTLLNEVYTAQEALQLGLVMEVVETEGLQAHALAFAKALATRAPLAVRLAKQMMRRAAHLTLEQSQGDAALAVEIANSAEDVREGIKAFFEKREPTFKGQ